MNRSELLAAYLAEVWGRPYRIGQWDCILFIAEWADRLMAHETDGDRQPDFAGQLRGAYTTEREGIAIFTARTGLNAAIATGLTIHDWQLIPIRSRDIPVPDAQTPCLAPGDIILTDLHHPGIWDGAAIVAQPAKSSGLLRLHPRHALLSLRAPHQ
ncbi:hypothetical protein OJ996_25990 [Luteolibacter sp. GHJ8]|uniref:DUF6950 domain-containing protein n=1 Tax=Luteolibacter rhizosphaerae TaxID=2989719 RepID=A0ABT3GB47_9BACT|nr:hypothetical protein [Luteolibacter rhizosphaerae]MCW1917067.1 hypothetical protein [Luteolibacter rhizosphaerae]